MRVFGKSVSTLKFPGHSNPTYQGAKSAALGADPSQVTDCIVPHAYPQAAKKRQDCSCCIYFALLAWVKLFGRDQDILVVCVERAGLWDTPRKGFGQ